MCVSLHQPEVRWAHVTHVHTHAYSSMSHFTSWPSHAVLMALCSMLAPVLSLQACSLVNLFACVVQHWMLSAYIFLGVHFYVYVVFCVDL